MGRKWFALLGYFFLGLMNIAYLSCDSSGTSVKEKDTSAKNPKNQDTSVEANTESDEETDTNRDVEVDTGTDISSYIDSEEATGCEHISISSAEISPIISTVGIVEWRADGELDSAYIEFGPVEGDYDLRAPVDLSETDHRTLLLGMKTGSIYKFRVVATIDGESCVSGAEAIQTGGRPIDLPQLQFSGASSGGYIVTTSFVSGVITGGNTSGTWAGAFILDEEGNYVWWYQPDTSFGDWVRARISYDGKYMWLANGNYPDTDSGTILRVRMDGGNEEVFSVPKRHHDLLVLPFDGIVAYMEYDTSGTGICDQVVEMTPDGDTRVVFRVRDHFADRAMEGEWCHSNALNYVESEDAYYLSVLTQNAIVKFDRTTGEVAWTFGGADSDFPRIFWNNQHQHHILENSILIFNNNGGATDDADPEDILEPTVYDGWSWSNAASHIVEYTFDEAAKTASLVWDYSDGKLGSFAMGDAKRLPNGNTQVVFSVSGVIQEVTPDQEKVYEIKRFGSFGYASRRDSLYTAPPEYDYYPKR